MDCIPCLRLPARRQPSRRLGSHKSLPLQFCAVVLCPPTRSVPTIPLAFDLCVTAKHCQDHSENTGVLEF